MKVVFNGVLETKSGGCIPCGRKRASKQSMTTRKEYILPSGTRKTFYLGRTEEVLDSDGEFLVSITSPTTDGSLHSAFTEVR